MHHATTICTTIPGDAPRFSKNAPRFRSMHQASFQNAPRKWEMHQAFSEVHQGKRENAPSLSHSIKIVVLSHNCTLILIRLSFHQNSACVERILPSITGACSILRYNISVISMSCRCAAFYRYFKGNAMRFSQRYSFRSRRHMMAPIPLFLSGIPSNTSNSDAILALGMVDILISIGYRIPFS